MKNTSPQLEPYKAPASRYRCPGCGKPRQFARYIDPQTGQHIADYVGRCNRQDGCGYHYTPRQYYENNRPINADSRPSYPYGQSGKQRPAAAPSKTKPGSTIEPQPVNIPVDLFKQSLQESKTVEQIAGGNTFVKYLLTLFPVDTVAGLITRYFVGTSNRQWPGATVFWFINTKGQIRAGQVKLFDATGHTATRTGKEGQPQKCTNWMHSILTAQGRSTGQVLPEWLQAYNNTEGKVDCLFGEHLLSKPENKGKMVALCESPKTAIIASVYLPQFVWVAAGALDWLNGERCKALMGRNVALFPDLSANGTAYKKWKTKSTELSQVAHFTISDLLETKATEAERKAGLDLADYLTKYDYRDFRHSKYQVADGTAFNIGCRYFFAEPAFAELELSTLQVSDGRLMDCLLYRDAGFVAEKTEVVKQIEQQYKKSFHVGNIYGNPCLLHIFQ